MRCEDELVSRMNYIKSYTSTMFHDEYIDEAARDMLVDQIDKMIDSHKSKENIDYYRDGFEEGYLKSMRQTYDKMHVSCNHGHEVQNPDDHKDWFQSCFLLETYEFNKETWKCCYERCPLLKEKI